MNKVWLILGVLSAVGLTFLFENCSGLSSGVSSAPSSNLVRLTALAAPPAGLSKDAGAFAPFDLAVNQPLAFQDVALIFQADGNLVLYRNAGQANQEMLWNTQTGNHNCGANCHASFQSDGNLALYDGGAAYWASNTNVPGGLLVLIGRAPFISIADQNGFVRWSPVTNLTWFAPLDNLFNYGSYRPGESDFLSIFAPGFSWAKHLKNVRVYKAYAQVIGFASDDQLRGLFKSLRDNHVALAIESCMANVGANGCGSGVEGYCDFSNPPAVAQRIKALGGDLAYVSMDEVFGGNLATNGCHQSPQDLATNAATVFQSYQAQFPMVQLGDIENVYGDANWRSQYLAWFDAISVATGKPLAFVHGDIDWRNLSQQGGFAGWSDLRTALAARKTPFGVIFNGATGLTSNENWIQSAIDNINGYYAAGQAPPEHPVFQSWDSYPTLAMPETSPAAHGYLLAYYASLHLSDHVPESPLAPAPALAPAPTPAPAPAPAPAAPPSQTGVKAVAMLRFYNAQTGKHFYSASAAEGQAGGNQLENTIFAFVGGTGTPGTFPIYRCMGQSLFISTSINCEGLKRVDKDAYGSLYITQGGAGKNAVYRLYNPASGDRLLTTNQTEGTSAGYQLEGIIGFAL